ncbi:MAG: DEAD/DEAH box helicase family protein [Clostridia bacterium]
MTNFDFLKNEPQFNSFADTAVLAERFVLVDVDTSVFNCRRAMEFAVKWLYSVDDGLVMPWDNGLYNLMNNQNFRDFVGVDLWTRLDFIRRIGNGSAHEQKKNTLQKAVLCLENLFIFMDFIACCYSKNGYTQRDYDKSILSKRKTEIKEKRAEKIDIEKLIEENKALKEELTNRRKENKKSYQAKPIDISEYETRKLYIDTMLEDVGWVEGKNWINEVELKGMPNKSGVGFADYVLYGDDGKALAVIEAKRTCVDISKGRQQGKLYADLLEKIHGKRPIIFLSNGFKTTIYNDKVDTTERVVASIYSKRDLEKLFNLQSQRDSLKNIVVNKNIAGRYYQVAAIKAVCQNFAEKNQRKSLLVMATGSGKTRTVIALVDILLKHGWIKNVLFLADRNSLITQAKRSFVTMLPDLSATDLCTDKDNYNAHCVFSTYQTMMNCIDEAHDEQGKLFTCGHFDIVICDEAHRSIYNKYKDIFTYFDAPLVGLTATPKDEIDKNTYDIFNLVNGEPTYGYELSQAVKDGYLVDFVTAETKLKFIENGIVYDDLPEDEKEAYEETFGDEDGNKPESIGSSALNNWIFNDDTIRKVINVLMEHGIKTHYGQRLGKTIVFAKNHKHAEKILEIFGKEYLNLPGYAKVIDNYTNYAQSAIDEFSESEKMPQIAISVDMLDTGIDVPEVVNLVFFKKVMSKAKFWQMIGRGTRLCEGLIDGKNKDKFYIFDFCGNFDFFRMNKGKATANQMALQSSIFKLKTEIVYKLQDIDFQTDDLIKFRTELVDEMVCKAKELNRENFAVKQHLKYVDLYSDIDSFKALSYENTLEITSELAPLILPDKDETSAIRFDALMYGIELAYLVGKKHGKARSDLVKKVQAISSIANIPEIIAQRDLIKQVLEKEYIDNAGINEFEHIRETLRGLMKFIKGDNSIYNTNFEDDILSIEWNDSELENDDLKNYKAKAEFYIREHKDNEVIQKLRTNIPLNSDDIQQLEGILWSEIGSKNDYKTELGEKPLGEFVREIVGLDMNAAKTAFAQYLDGNNLDSRQLYFVNQIVEYIVQNGMMKDLSVLQELPFTEKGSVVEVFTDLSVWIGIKSIIDKINANVAA